MDSLGFNGTPRCLVKAGADAEGWLQSPRGWQGGLWIQGLVCSEVGREAPGRLVGFGAANPACPMEQGPWQALRRGGCTNPATSSLFPPSFYRTLTPGGHSANPLGTAGRTGTLKPFKPWRGTDPICALHALQPLGSPPAPQHPLPNLLPPRAHLQPSAPHGSPLSLHFFSPFFTAQRLQLRPRAPARGNVGEERGGAASLPGARAPCREGTCSQSS